MAGVTEDDAPRLRRVRASPAPTTSDPIEIAMDAEAEGVAPEGVAHEVLRKQSALIGWQIASERAGFALKVLTGIAGLVAAGVLGLMAWNAGRADGVVIEAFAVPPDLAAKGYSGQALASRVQDRLNELQAETWDVRPAATYLNSWGHDIRVEIPTTGVSLGDVDQVLRGWLGHETHVAGDLVRAPEGLSLTIRSGDRGTEVTGKEADMRALVQRAAEALYGQTQPYRYGAYLAGKGRNPEARAVLERLADDGPTQERAWALARLAQLEDDPRLGLARAHEAVALDPKLALGWLAIANRSRDVATQKAALGKAAALIQGRGHGGYSDKMVLLSHAVAANLNTYNANYFACANEARDALKLARDGRTRGQLESSVAFCLSQMHETTAAKAAVHNIPDAERMKRLPDGGIEQTFIMSAFVGEDLPALLENATAVKTMLLASANPTAHAYAETRATGMQSIALLASGRLAEGRAMVEKLPSTCHQECDAYRYYFQEVSGDVAGADRKLGELAHLLHQPSAYNYWGRLRLRRGDNEGAAAVFAEGLQYGPWFADLWQGWGEALLNNGDAAGAIAKFAEAQKTAPNWARLHLKWGEALARQGKTKEARAKWTAAAGMDLTPSERAELVEVSRKQTR